MSKHTPGPWKSCVIYRNNTPDRIAVLEDRWGGRIIADCDPFGDLKWEVNVANGNLLAAAPGMLKALERISQHAYDDDTSTEDITADFDAMRQIAFDAIAKATR